jgi:hypothetical protein
MTKANPRDLKSVVTSRSGVCVFRKLLDGDFDEAHQMATVAIF